MIDTHCHIEKEDYKNIDEILKKCHENGVSKIIISGCDVESCLNVDKLTKKYENVYGTVGYLPDVINSKPGYVPTERMGDLIYRVKPLNEYVNY